VPDAAYELRTKHGSEVFLLAAMDKSRRTAGKTFFEGSDAGTQSRSINPDPTHTTADKAWCDAHASAASSATGDVGDFGQWCDSENRCIMSVYKAETGRANLVSQPVEDHMYTVSFDKSLDELNLMDMVKDITPQLCKEDCPSAPTPLPTPVPTPVPTLPTPSPTREPKTKSTMGGDPHVNFNGTRTTIHLPNGYMSKLIEQGSVAVLAKGDDSDSGNYIHMISVTVDGKQALRIEQKTGDVHGWAHPMAILVDGRARHGSFNTTVAAGEMSVECAGKRVKALHLASGFGFEVTSEPSLMHATKDSHHLNIRVGEGLIMEGQGKAHGVLPQIWGIQPLSDAVAALIRNRRSLHVKRAWQ